MLTANRTISSTSIQVTALGVNASIVSHAPAAWPIR